MASQSKPAFKRGFKIIVSYLKDHKKEIVVISVLGIIGAAVGAWQN